MANILLPANISKNVFRSPTNVENSSTNVFITVPAASSPLTEAERNFALVTSLTIANKTLGAVEVNAKIVNGTESAHILYGVSIPAGTAFEVIQGNKFILKEGDSLYVWHNSTASNVIDVIASYTIHVPNNPYTV
jgi:hypothetical protein